MEPSKYLQLHLGGGGDALQEFWGRQEHTGNLKRRASQSPSSGCWRGHTLPGWCRYIHVVCHRTWVLRAARPSRQVSLSSHSFCAAVTNYCSPSPPHPSHSQGLFPTSQRLPPAESPTSTPLLCSYRGRRCPSFLVRVTARLSGINLPHLFSQGCHWSIFALQWPCEGEFYTPRRPS